MKLNLALLGFAGMIAYFLYTLRAKEHFIRGNSGADSRSASSFNTFMGNHPILGIILALIIIVLSVLFAIYISSTGVLQGF